MYIRASFTRQHLPRPSPTLQHNFRETCSNNSFDRSLLESAECLIHKTQGRRRYLCAIYCPRTMLTRTCTHYAMFSINMKVYIVIIFEVSTRVTDIEILLYGVQYYYASRTSRITRISEFFKKKKNHQHCMIKLSLYKRTQNRK